MDDNTADSKEKMAAFNLSAHLKRSIALQKFALRRTHTTSPTGSRRKNRPLKIASKHFKLEFLPQMYVSYAVYLNPARSLEKSTGNPSFLVFVFGSDVFLISGCGKIVDFRDGTLLLINVDSVEL